MRQSVLLTEGMWRLGTLKIENLCPSSLQRHHQCHQQIHGSRRNLIIFDRLSLIQNSQVQLLNLFRDSKICYLRFLKINVIFDLPIWIKCIFVDSFIVSHRNVCLNNKMRKKMGLARMDSLEFCFIFRWLQANLKKVI